MSKNICPSNVEIWFLFVLFYSSLLRQVINPCHSEYGTCYNIKIFLCSIVRSLPYDIKYLEATSVVVVLNKIKTQLN